MGSRGETLLKKHWGGERLTRGQALLAKCADCMNRYVDGRRDCQIPKCPLYPFAPYHGASEDEVSTESAQEGPQTRPASGLRGIAPSDPGTDVSDAPEAPEATEAP